jgi:hypothetical protein
VRGVGEDERVEPVVLAARGAVAAAQILQLVRRDHHHGDASLEQSLHDRSIGPLDRNLLRAMPGQQVEQLAQPGGAVLDGSPGRSRVPGR